MPRTRHAGYSKRRKKRILKAARGYYGQRSRTYVKAKETGMRAMRFASRDRRVRKREFRALWVQRINAACRQAGTTYGRFIAGLKRSRVAIDRKMLADLAVRDQPVFERLLELAKAG